MKKLFILIFSIVIAGELEVDGDLKVNGTVDAQGNPITNVGAPQTLTDAVNAGILASALSDDGDYEYKLVATRLTNEMLQNFGSFTLSYKNYGETSWSSNFESYLNTLEDSGWNIYKTLPYTYDSSYQMSYNYYIFRRTIEE